jgi:serine/threonine protein kinase
MASASASAVAPAPVEESYEDMMARMQVELEAEMAARGIFYSDSALRFVDNIFCFPDAEVFSGGSGFVRAVQVRTGTESEVLAHVVPLDDDQSIHSVKLALKLSGEVMGGGGYFVKPKKIGADGDRLFLSSDVRDIAYKVNLYAALVFKEGEYFLRTDLDRIEDGEQVFGLVMLMYGHDLNVRMDHEDLKLSGDQTKIITAQLAASLSQMHERGIIHRDVKPQNTLLDKVGDWVMARICDYDLAKRLEPGKTAIAKDRARVTGTVGYVPPEALNEDFCDIDSSADLWGLGCVLYKAATGEHLFEQKAETAEQMRRQHIDSMIKYCGEYRERPDGIYSYSLGDRHDECLFCMEAPRLVEMFPDVEERMEFIKFVKNLLNPDRSLRLAAFDMPFMLSANELLLTQDELSMPIRDSLDRLTPHRLFLDDWRRTTRSPLFRSLSGPPRLGAGVSPLRATPSPAGVTFGGSPVGRARSLSVLRAATPLPPVPEGVAEDADAV